MPLILPSNTISAAGYDVANSLRFDGSSSDSLTKTFGTPTNNKIWTYSFWIKNCDNDGVFLNTGADTSYMYLRNSGASPVSFGFSVEQYVGSFQYRLIPNEVFRDHSAWQHIVIAFDTTQSTASNRVKIYKNGTQITSFNTADYPSQNLDTQVNSAVAHKIGGFASSGFYDGYLAETVFIDGQQLDPTSFGEFDADTGIWKPIDVSGLTFGNNGFYLDFENSGSLGADVSGNGNNFTVNNLTSIDQTTDTPTNNYATLNPLNVPASNQPTFSEGNLKVNPNTSTGGFRFGGTSTIGVSSGKWYIEAKATIDATYSRNEIGVTGEPSNLARQNYGLSQGTNSSVYYKSENGIAGINAVDSYTGSTYTTGDIVGIALDMDNLKVYFSKNGTWQNSGDPESGATGTGAISLTALSSTSEGNYFFMSSDNTGTSADAIFEFNFGSPPYSISSGNSDANGYGNFEYSVPSGYYSLNTKNLSEFG